MATATARVDIDLDYAAIFRLQTTTAQGLASSAARSVQFRARRYAPKKTGALAASIGIEVKMLGPVTVYQVGSDLHYAGYQEWGTGPIYPSRRGGVLVFEGRDGGTVFARSTRGVPATHFMAQAAAHITAADFTS